MVTARLFAPVVFIVFVLSCATAEAAGPTSREADERAALRRFVEHVVRGDATPAPQTEAVRRWVANNGEAMKGVEPSGLAEQPWGLSARSTRPAGAQGEQGRLYLHVFDWHASGRLVVYGLTGGIGKAYLLADASRAELPAQRVGSSAVLTVPEAAPDPFATVVVIELKGEPETTPIVARPDPAGRVVMHARDAIVHGRTLRYEPEPHKDTVGYWTDAKDWLNWDFEVAEAGTYAVEILQGCGKGNGGSVVHFAVGDQVIPVTVQDTGGFQNFVSRCVGTLTFAKPGRYRLDVRPVTKAGKAVMDLRSVTLTSSGGQPR